MSTSTSTDAPARAARAGNVVTDTWIVTWRNLKRIPRIPELAIFAILQSIMFVLLFVYVFGGAIRVPQGTYEDFLLPGIFAQTLVFAAGTTAIGMTDDMSKGLVDRFRSLPMARSAFLTGRTVADVFYNAGILLVLMLSGLAVGWRVRDGALEFLGGVALSLLFAYAMSWMGVYLGQLVPTVEVANQVIFTVLFPITFMSSVFVPIDTLPGVLQPVADWNPTSTLSTALRDLFGNPVAMSGGTIPSEHPILVTVGWCLVTVAVFAPLATWRYRSRSH